MRDDLLYIRHMLDAITSIERYVAGVSFEEFTKREMMRNAVVRELEIVGETSRHLSEEYKSGTKNIPWRDVGDMRNKLIHEYFDVDIDAVWKTVCDDLPLLKVELKKGVDERKNAD